MNLKLICLFVVIIEVVEVRCDCDDYLKCFGDAIKGLFGAKNVTKVNIVQNTTDYKSEGKTNNVAAQNTSIHVFDIADSLQQSLSRILTEVTRVVKDQIEENFNIQSEDGPFQTKSNKSEINIQIIDISKQPKTRKSVTDELNNKNNNIDKNVKSKTNYPVSGNNANVNVKYVNGAIASTITPEIDIKSNDKKTQIISESNNDQLFSDLWEQQKEFLESFIKFAESDSITRSLELESKVKSTDTGAEINTPSKVYLPNAEVNQIFRDFMRYNENSDFIIDLPKIESNYSFTVEKLNNSESYKLHNLSDSLSEIIKTHNIKDISKNYESNKDHTQKSPVQVDIEKAKVVILTHENNKTESILENNNHISNNTSQDREYLPVESGIAGIKEMNLTKSKDKKDQRKYLPTHTTESVDKPHRKEVTLTDNMKNNKTKSVANSTLENRKNLPVKADRVIQETKRSNTSTKIKANNNKSLPLQSSANKNIAIGKSSLATNKNEKISNTLNNTSQNRKYLPMQPEQTKKKNMENKSAAEIRNSTKIELKKSNDTLITNKYLLTTPETKMEQHAKVPLTTEKTNENRKYLPVQTTTTESFSKNILNDLEIDRFEIINTTNTEDLISNENFEENEVFTDDFEIYNNYDDEDNTTDYPVIDYIELYRDTTNEKVDYVPTTPPEFRSDLDNAIDYNKEGENNGYYGASLSEAIFPWIATIFVKNGSNNQFDYYCDGAILSANMVLTSARCVTATNSSAGDFIVIVGKRSLQVTGESEKAHRVKRIILHDKFSASENETNNDLAILELEDDLVFNNDTKAACIWDGEDGSQDQDAFTTGWDFVGNLTAIRLQDDQSCIGISPETFCTVFGNNVAVCPSHGGIHAKKQKDDQFCLNGIRSSKTATRGLCVDRNVLFTDVSVYKDWINTILNDNKGV